MEDYSQNDQHQQLGLAEQISNQWRRYRKLLLSYWWMIPLAVAGGLGVQWLWLKAMPPSFVSEGQMIVNVKLDIPSAATYSEELDNFFGTQVALMEGDSVLNRVKIRLKADHPEFHPTPVKLQVALIPKTSIFNLMAVGEDGHYTQLYLQATMEEYIKLKRDLLSNASSAAKSNIEEELKQLSSKVQISRQALLDFQTSNSVVLLQENGGNSAAIYLSNLNRQLAQNQSELQMLANLTLDENLERQRGISAPANSTADKISTSEAEISDPKDVGMSSPASFIAVQNNPLSLNNTPTTLGGFEEGYLKAKQQILLLKAKRDELAQVLKPKHPDIIALSDEIASQERLLNIYRTQNQEQLKDRQHTLEVQIDDLKMQIVNWNLKALDASKKLADFDVLNENHRRLQVMFDQIQANLQTLEVDKGIGQETVTVLEPATPAINIPQKTVQRLVMAGIAGLVLVFGILALLNWLDDRPATTFELESQFDHPVLAQFPLLKSPNKTNNVPILQLEDERHMLVEAFQNLRSALIYKDNAESHPRRIVITSATSHCGKSTISTNFAITLARSGAKVLLIDADLRRGVLHKHFSAPVGPGLAEVLTRQCNWDKAIIQTSIPSLFLLSAGICRQQPGSLLAMQIGKFLAEIRGHFDYYIFDTAPIMAADDVSNLAPLVDGVIMVIRAGHTSSRITQSALELLLQRKVNVIGLVLNAVPTGKGDGYHYYQDKNYYPSKSTT